MTSVIQEGINAVSLGGLYALAGLGIALIFGVMRLINFAQGSIIMASAYMLWLLRDLPVGAALILTILFAGLLGVLMERLAFRPVRNADLATLLVTSFFLASFLQNLGIVIFGSRSKGVSILPSLTTPVDIGSVTTSGLDIATLGASIGLLLVVGLVLTRTLLGLQIRAASEHFTMARLMGVRANAVISAAFFISAVLAAAVAILLVARTGNVYPDTGLQPVIVGFIAAVLGGLGSLRGAVLGGFIIGALTVVLQSHLPDSLVGYRDVFVYATVLVLFIIRPQGLWPTPLGGDRV